MKQSNWIVTLIGLSLGICGYSESNEPTFEELMENSEVIIIHGSYNPYDPYEMYYARKEFEAMYPERRPFNENDLTFDKLDKAIEIFSFGEYTIKKSPTYKLSTEAMAQNILFKQDQIISIWENAIFSFYATLSSPSKKSATPNYSKALQNYFEKKIVGILVNDGIPGLPGLPLPGILKPMEVFKTLGDEYDRAKKASAEVAIRDFSVEQMKYASIFRQGLGLNSEAFAGAIESVDKLGVPFAPSQKIDGTKLLDALNAELATTGMEEMFYDLTTMWIGESKTEDNQRAHVVVKLEEGQSINEVKIVAPSGDGIAEKLNGFYPEGTDIFRMKDVQIRVIQMQEGTSWPKSVVLVENGLVEFHPAFEKEGAEVLADYVYGTMVNNKYRFK